MKTIYDIQQLLKRFGVFVYTGDRIGDLELMETEINELYKMNFIELNVYQMARLILMKASNEIDSKNKGGGKDEKNNSRR